MARQSVSDLECSFGNESCSGTRRSISVKITRDELTAEEMDELVTNNKLDVTLIGFPAKGRKRKGDVDGQTLMSGGQVAGDDAKKKIKVDGIVECAGFGAKAEQFTFTLRFEKDTVDVDALAGRSGKISMKKAGRIEKPEKKSDKAPEKKD